MMKSLSILAAASLALAPALASAGAIGNNSVGASSDSTTNNRPISGPVAGHHLKNEEIPVGAIIVGTLVILGGVVIGVLAAGGGSDSNNGTNDAPAE
ncbi:MAG TPA: hypothetical protein VMY41_00885 [Thermohalobaculum sp.]|nr:hypothetical protein [Thermohalobaculum sp.]